MDIPNVDVDNDDGFKLNRKLFFTRASLLSDIQIVLETKEGVTK